MRVLFDTYPWAFVAPGGGERQLLEYAKNLPGHGVEVVLHDHWNPTLDAVDAVHFFSCIGGSWHFCNYVRERSLPLVISTSLWIEEETKHLYPSEEIRSQLLLADVIVTNSNAEVRGACDGVRSSARPICGGHERDRSSLCRSARFRPFFKRRSILEPLSFSTLPISRGERTSSIL